MISADLAAFWVPSIERHQAGVNSRLNFIQSDIIRLELALIIMNGALIEAHFSIVAIGTKLRNPFFRISYT